MKKMILRNDRVEGGKTIRFLTFDKPDSAANTFDAATLEALEAELEAVETDPAVHAVIFTSAKEHIFIAGADLGLLAKGGSSPEMLETYLRKGQELFNRIAGLTVPTVAAIHGACVGGGYELALACDWRVATDDSHTRIGLPETKLGILPAWGGSTRLPRLVGVPRALDLILGGKTPPARRALRLGLVDEVVPREWLERAALRRVSQGKRRQPGAIKRLFTRAVGAAAARQARPGLEKKTRGHYPAVLKALEVVAHGADEREVYPSLQRERAAVAELISLPESRNLFHVYLLTERARKLARGAEGRTEAAAVIGAGVMGAGIAQWLSAKGVRVLLRDVDAERVGAGMGRIRKLYEEAVRRHALTRQQAREGLDLISPAGFAARPARIPLIIEAATEQLALKRQIFEALDAEADEGALLATNTSALPVGELAQVARRHVGRVVGFHFFNPVHRMPLVELVIPEGTTPEARAEALHWVQRIGKLPVVVADRPGFLVNRVLLPYLLEAARAFAEGLSATEVDEAMLAFGMPMGPLRLADEVGLDVALHVAQTLAAAYPERMQIPPLLPKLVEAGLLGRKVGRGFYLHTGAKGPNPEAEALRGEVGTVPTVGGTRSRMVFRMLDEAARCLEEGVVEAPEDVDFGMVMGTGFPPFRGGPLRHADALGVARVVEEMLALNLKPCSRLCEMAAKGDRFYEDTE